MGVEGVLRKELEGEFVRIVVLDKRVEGVVEFSNVVVFGKIFDVFVLVVVIIEFDLVGVILDLDCDDEENE